MPTMFQNMATNLATNSSYDNLDANGNTAADIACLKDPNCDMNQHLLDTLNYVIDQGANCDGTDCGAGIPSSSIPSWLWLVAAIAGGWMVLEAVEKT